MQKKGNKMAKIQEYAVEGRKNNELHIISFFKVITAKLAEQRFTKKNASMLVGSWQFKVLDSGGITKRTFEIINGVATNSRAIKNDSTRKAIKNDSTQKAIKNDSTSNKGINPKIKAGKLAMEVLKKNYSDGAIPTMTGARGQVYPVVYLMGRNAWHGKGRRPRWLCDYEAKGGNLADIKIEIAKEKNCSLDNEEVKGNKALFGRYIKNKHGNYGRIIDPEEETPKCMIPKEGFIIVQYASTYDYITKKLERVDNVEILDSIF